MSQIKAEDGASETARTRVIDWYDGTLSTRLNDKERGVIFLVMQRLHQEDLAGFVIERGSWHELSLPAIATDDQAVPIGPDEMYHRKADSILHPARESRETLERIKAEIGSLQFSAVAAHIAGSGGPSVTGRNRAAACTTTPAGSHMSASGQNPCRAIHPCSSMA